ncbi:ribbon-helix-helix protein, CopG family [Leptolyngbya sp. FACHB-36]|uniref:ribbon-helix-helix domain-containing protein n=1 Tax=Leptolyngbya sp. FACHB-36 TaxID=2692808 RepID=UPI0016802A4B|nr:ribbon-helix-helix protein, CopG family [Leptolyngbya sp. FACHB-36]MBD2019919.1 ribbon-helix-helix protein, CopG family [Leptolyngbya sp. FACHB-36]
MTVQGFHTDLMPSDKPRVTVYLDEETKNDLEKLAKANERPVSNFVLVLIKEAISRAKSNGVIAEQHQSGSDDEKNS